MRYNALISQQKVLSGEDFSSEPDQARKGKLIFSSNLSSQITYRKNSSCNKPKPWKFQVIFFLLFSLGCQTMTMEAIFSVVFTIVDFYS